MDCDVAGGQRKFHFVIVDDRFIAVVVGLDDTDAEGVVAATIGGPDGEIIAARAVDLPPAGEDGGAGRLVNHQPLKASRLEVESLR